jgi:long-chain acyl-CoA synthetase
VNGLVRSMITSLATGAVLVPVAQYERRQVGQTIERHRISVFIGVPFMFAVLGDTRWPRPVDFSSLRLCVSSSAPLKHETVQKFHERYGIAIRQLYGTTETGSIAVNMDADASPSWESVGTPLPGVDVQAFSDTYEPLPRGEKGLLGIRSPSAISAYADPATGRDSIVNGWFFPGDVGRCDAEGRVYLEGRRSLFINRGGYKVNPYEVEAVLERHPNVREAVVVGVLAEHGDQKVKAIVVPAEPCTEREIVDHCRVALADFKVPSIVEFRTELPKSSAGKILRSAL